MNWIDRKLSYLDYIFTEMCTQALNWQTWLVQLMHWRRMSVKDNPYTNVHQDLQCNMVSLGLNEFLQIYYTHYVGVD